MEFKKICMLGLGYIGLPTASMFANAGLEVVGVDVNEDVVRMLQGGELHIHEPGLRDAVRQAIETGRLTFSNQTVEADAFIIAVPTPFYDDKRADMRAVTTATEMILPVLRKGNLVVLEFDLPAAHHHRPGRADPRTQRPESRRGFPPVLTRRSGCCPVRFCAN